jgi:hypothetical protein
MEMDELDDAITHIESASSERLRAALREVAQDSETLSPLLATAAQRSPEARTGSGSSWLVTLRRPRYLLLATIALLARIGIGGLAAGRACSETPGIQSLTSTPAPASGAVTGPPSPSVGQSVSAEPATSTATPTPATTATASALGSTPSAGSATVISSPTGTPETPSQQAAPSTVPGTSSPGVAAGSTPAASAEGK